MSFGGGSKSTPKPASEIPPDPNVGKLDWKDPGPIKRLAAEEAKPAQLLSGSMAATDEEARRQKQYGGSQIG